MYKYVDTPSKSRLQVVMLTMNILKKIHSVRFNLGMYKYEKHLDKTKKDALKRNWNPEAIKRDNELWNEGHDQFVYRRWMDDGYGKLTLASLSPAVLRDSLQNTIKGVQTKLMMDGRRKYWDNVFAFLPKEHAPSFAFTEFLVQDTEPDSAGGWSSISTFSYPVSAGTYEERHGFEREFPLGDYDLYERLSDKIKERIGLPLVYVEPVGRITEDGKEISGTIGDLGFRIWVGEDNGMPLFHAGESDLWGRILKYRALIVSPIQKLEGMRNTLLESSAVTRSSEVEGDFHVITVGSETLNARDYMERADEIRETLGVPGLMISYSARLKPESGLFFASNKPVKADSNGVHYTTFTFYSGNETEVKLSKVDAVRYGAPTSVISGFMPIHSAKSIPRTWRATEAAANVA